MRDEGKWTEGRPPFGYRRCEVTKKLVVVEADAEVIREMFARCIRGESIAQIGARFRARQIGRSLGGPVVGWDKKAVHRMLRSRWYTGEIRNTSGVWERVHDAIVDGATFKRAQDAMAGRAFGGRRADPNSRTNEWLMRGLAVCGQCGARMGAAYGPRAHAHPYYACAARSRGRGCAQPYARVDAADALASAAAVRRLEELRDVFAEQGQSPEARGDLARLEALQRGLAGIIQRRERLVSLAVDGAITKDELKARARKLDDERANSEAAIAEEEARLRPLPKETVASVLREVKIVRKAWRKATMPERREILAWLAERIVIDVGVPTIEWASAESVCASAVGRSLNGPTVAAPLNKLRKAGVR